ncbi:hypothetical protein K501DRAFT_334032 [Backusella circina FSU 941]|nr:hypothetical protein K501DRAFT_334032 [Backusella circina FSU 941]
MATLIPEILDEIFLHLHQNDKLECALVCRQWKETLEQYALYQTMIIRSWVSLDKLLEKIQQRPSITRKVEKLILNFSDTEFKASLDTLLLLLPNIKTLYYIGGDPEAETSIDSVEYPWKKGIKEIVDYSTGGPAYRLFSTSQCPNLKSVIMHSGSDYIGLFHNMQNLTTLVLNHLDVSFKVLDNMHDNLTQLVSLSLQHGTLTGSPLNLEKIQPANSVTECSFQLHIVRPDTNATRLNLLKYIRDKYPNMSSLSHDVKRLDDETEDDIEEINTHGWHPLFRQLGPQLKKVFFANYSYNSGLLGILDQCDCQIARFGPSFHLMERLADVVKSKQSSYIQTFDFFLLQDDILGGFSWLKNFGMLTKLKLNDCEKTVIKLHDILDNAPPTLRILSLTWINLDGDLDCTNVYNNIHTLSFKSVTLSANMGTFISRCIPKLSKLKLKCCNIPDNTLNLGNLDISNFYFMAYFRDPNPLLLTSCKNEQRYYTLKYTDMNIILTIGSMDKQGIYIPFQSTTENRLDLKTHFTLICNSVKLVKFVT